MGQRMMRHRETDRGPKEEVRKGNPLSTSAPSETTTMTARKTTITGLRLQEICSQSAQYGRRKLCTLQMSLKVLRDRSSNRSTSHNREIDWIQTLKVAISAIDQRYHYRLFQIPRLRLRTYQMARRLSATRCGVTISIDKFALGESRSLGQKLKTFYAICTLRESARDGVYCKRGSIACH
ncbi:hypothetical protein Tco_0179329 [Tanacetum coccineum]